MKSVLAAALFFAAPALVWAQSAASATDVAPGKSPAVKSAAAKPRAGIKRSALKAVEEVTPIDDDLDVTLTEADLELAKRVFVGVIPCELGANVTITPSEKRAGFFLVQTKTAKFRMHPVESRTGAIRLEDPRAGAMWLQLGNKSMLMSQKLGQRLADECMAPDQVVMAANLKANPVPSILDEPKPVVGK
jgi:hypothetical protein